MSGDSRVSALDLSESVVQTWANGTVSTMGPAHLEQLYAEELSLYSGPSAFKGRFAWRPVADARDTAGAMLLSSPDDRSAVGLLWITVDADCTLQYEVSSSLGHPSSPCSPRPAEGIGCGVIFFFLLQAL